MLNGFIALMEGHLFPVLCKGSGAVPNWQHLIASPALEAPDFEETGFAASLR